MGWDTDSISSFKEAREHWLSDGYTYLRTLLCVPGSPSVMVLQKVLRFGNESIYTGILKQKWNPEWNRSYVNESKPADDYKYVEWGHLKSAPGSAHTLAVISMGWLAIMVASAVTMVVGFEK